MDLSISAIVAIIAVTITLLTTFAIVVAGFVRMETKNNQNTSDIADLYNKVETHTADKTVHHDGEELNRRFADITKGMSEIKAEIKEGIGGLTKRFDDFLSK